jgi:hypothetical protein
MLMYAEVCWRMLRKVEALLRRWDRDEDMRLGHAELMYVADTYNTRGSVALEVLLYIASAYVSIRQHTSAYVSIRQHTSAYVQRARQRGGAADECRCWLLLSIRQHTSAYVSIRTTR